MKSNLNLSFYFPHFCDKEAVRAAVAGEQNAHSVRSYTADGESLGGKIRMLREKSLYNLFVFVL